MASRFLWADVSSRETWSCQLPPRFSVEDFSQEMEGLADALLELPSGRRLTVLIDLTLVESSDPRRRAAAARFFNARANTLRLYVAAWGFVSVSPLIRGSITAISWLASFPMPVRVFADTYGCSAWLAQVLALEQMGRPTPTLPPGLSV
jgi:hypothetical protein